MSAARTELCQQPVSCCSQFFVVLVDGDVAFPAAEADIPGDVLEVD